MAEGVAVSGGNTLPKDYEIKVAILGETGVGKSSLIQAFTTNVFPRDGTVAHVLTPHLLRSSITRELSQSNIHRALATNNITLLDSDGDAFVASQASFTAELEKLSPDVIILCHSLADPYSLSRVVEQWLPRLAASGYRKPNWPYVPVLLCGTKEDRRDNFDISAWCDAAKRVLERTAAVAAGTAAAGAALQQTPEEEVVDAFIRSDGSMTTAAAVVAGRGSGGAAGAAARDTPSTPSLDAWQSSSSSGRSEEQEHAAAARQESLQALQSKPADTILERLLHRIVISFPSVLGSMSISALEPSHPEGILGEVGDTLLNAVGLVMHPAFPLFNHQTGEGTPALEQAIERIFRMADRDGDGDLSVDEFRTLLHLSTGLRMLDEDIERVFSSQAEVNPEGMAQNGLFMRPQGLLAICMQYMIHGYTDKVWEMLQAFGYRLGVRPQLPERVRDEKASLLPADADKSCSGLLDELQEITAPGQFGLYLHLPEAFVDPQLQNGAGSSSSSSAAAALAASQYGGRDCSLELTGLPTGGPLEALDDTALRRLSLTASETGLGFLASLFLRYGTQSEQGTLLYPVNVDAIFSVTSSRRHPFGELFPFTCMHSFSKAINFTSWLNLWTMLLSAAPSTALQSLYELGYSRLRVSRETGAQLMLFDPRAAVKAGPARKSAASAARPVSSMVRRIFVVGSKGCGKTSLILHFILEGSAGVGEFRRHFALPAAVEAGEVGVGQVARPSHYVSSAPRKSSATAAGGAGAAAAASSSSRAEEEVGYPQTLIITEWPEVLLDKCMSEASTQCDAMLLVVDPHSPASLQFFLTAVQEVPDNVPCTVVSSLAATGAAGAAAPTAPSVNAGKPLSVGNALLRSLCSPAAQVDLLQLSEEEEVDENQISALLLGTGRTGLQAAAGALIQQVPSLAARAAGGAAATASTSDGKKEEKSDSSSAAASTVSGPLLVPGLNLEVYCDFHVKGRPAAFTQDLFRFLAMRSRYQGNDNPRTQQRRDRDWKKKMQKAAAVAVPAVLLLAGAAAYFTHTPFRSSVDARCSSAKSAVQSLFSSIKAKVSGGGWAAAASK